VTLGVLMGTSVFLCQYMHHVPPTQALYVGHVCTCAICHAQPYAHLGGPGEGRCWQQGALRCAFLTPAAALAALSTCKFRMVACWWLVLDAGTYMYGGALAAGR
jgi:hypothetical protein